MSMFYKNKQDLYLNVYLLNPVNVTIFFCIYFIQFKGERVQILVFYLRLHHCCGRHQTSFLAHRKYCDLYNRRLDNLVK